MICEMFEEGMREMNIGGCVDCTESVKNEIIEDMKDQGVEPDDVFDWEDNKGDTYWHLIP